jgi:Flp pilus assembly protein TadD
MGLLGQHAKLFFWPRYLSLFRTFDLASSLHSVWPVVVLAFIVLALFLRKGSPLAGFLILWWPVTLLPTLDVRQVNLPVADRFSFLPSLGPCLVLAWFVLDWLPKHLHVPQPALAGALGVVMILCTVQDVRSVARWHDNVTLWDQAYLASPNSALAHMLHGVVLQQRDAKFAEAAREYRLALQLNQSSERPLVGVATECYVMLGQVANIQGHTQEAIDDFNEAIRIAPGNAQAYKSLGILYFPHGEYAESKVYFQKAVEFAPDDLESKFFLGTCLLKTGDPLAAAAEFRTAHEADSTYLQAFVAEAHALDVAGDKVGAARVRASIPKH